MSAKKRIFISSVQKELELERAAVAGLIATDPFLLQHYTPVLFEKEPSPPYPASRPYLDSLRGCAVYMLLIAKEKPLVPGLQYCNLSIGKVSGIHLAKTRSLKQGMMHNLLTGMIRLV